MKITMLSILALSVLLFSAFDKENELSIGDGMPMADKQLKNIDKSKESLSSYAKDRGLLVLFSCNTCPFVIGNDSFEGWEKDYEKIREFTNKNNIGFVLVNSNEAKRKKGDGLKDMIQRAKEYDYKMPYLYDKGHELADAFGAKTTPHAYLFDASLSLIYKGSIDDTYKPTVDSENASHFLKDAILSNATGKEIDPNSTSPKGCSIKRK
jgi:thioredoxin-related protein